MNLFNDQDVNDFIKDKNLSISNDIDKLSNSQIQNTNIEELIEYFISKYFIETIKFYVENKKLELTECEIQTPNPWHRSDPYESQYYISQGYNITFNIPFEGDTSLLYLIPTSRILTRFVINSIDTFDKEHLSYIIYSIQLSASELDKVQNQADYIESTFINNFKNYITMADYVNKSINFYNNNLESFIRKEIESKKEKSTKFLALAQNLNIPLTLSNNAPNLKPIPIKIKKELKQFPKEKKLEDNWCIDDKEYNNIKNILSLACISFEHTPTACQKLNEEELRDMLLSNLNTHYDSQATGETFSKVGKTDIRIQFNNKSAFIGECKIWHGNSEFEKALLQLFSYTTWRDIKTSLIIFNKDIKDFKSILNKIDTNLSNNQLLLNKSRLSENQWQCIFKKSIDTTETVQVHIIISDIMI